jgi:hypothetical protein
MPIGALVGMFIAVGVALYVVLVIRARADCIGHRRGAPPGQTADPGIVCVCYAPLLRDGDRVREEQHPEHELFYRLLEGAVATDHAPLRDIWGGTP